MNQIGNGAENAFRNVPAKGLQDSSMHFANFPSPTAARLSLTYLLAQWSPDCRQQNASRLEANN